MSEIDRDLIPSREEERLLKRALGCAIPEFIARFGAAERSQAGRSGIAARKARPLPETLCLLERRPGAHRPRQE